jgi:hypothetical protein
MKDTYKVLLGKLERKRPRRKTRCRWEDYIRMDVREMKWENVD